MSEEWTSRSARKRTIVEGRLASDGSRSTVVLESREGGGWLIYMWGLSKDAVVITNGDARQIADGLGAQEQERPSPRTH